MQARNNAETEWQEGHCLTDLSWEYTMLERVVLTFAPMFSLSQLLSRSINRNTSHAKSGAGMLLPRSFGSDISVKAWGAFSTAIWMISRQSRICFSRPSLLDLPSSGKGGSRPAFKIMQINLLTSVTLSSRRSWL